MSRREAAVAGKDHALSALAPVRVFRGVEIESPLWHYEVSKVLSNDPLEYQRSLSKRCYEVGLKSQLKLLISGGMGLNPRKRAQRVLNGNDITQDDCICLRKLAASYVRNP